jgi:hypothetical protein
MDITLLSLVLLSFALLALLAPSTTLTLTTIAVLATATIWGTWVLMQSLGSSKSSWRVLD